MSAAFWDRIARRYAARPVRDPAAYARTLERAAAWLNPTDLVVEFGCGTGATALALAEHVARIDASDFSAGMIAIARARAAESAVARAGKRETAGAPRAAFTQADLFDAAALPGPYDAALAFNFLQLMPDLPMALEAIARRVRPGGLLVSKTVCLGEPGWRVVRTLVRGLKAVGVAPPLQFHTIAGLDRAVEAAGFAILERGVFPERPPARFLVARKAGGG